MGKGILLIGIGDNYQQLAYNLLKTIRKHSPKLKIAIITDDNGTYFLDEFDYVIEPKIEHFLENRKLNPFLLKTFINEYTPFDKTLYLDVDTVCLKPIDSLFEHSFYIQEVSRYTYANASKCAMVWVKKAGLSLTDIYDAYKIPHDREYPEHNSSIILFTKEHDSYFKQVQRYYKDRRLAFKDIGSFYPDELAFNLATTMTQTYSDSSTRYMYFQWENKINKLTDIIERYYFLGMAGGYHTIQLRTMYENLVKGLSTPFKKFNSKKKIFHQK